MARIFGPVAAAPCGASAVICVASAAIARLAPHPKAPAAKSRAFRSIDSPLLMGSTRNSPIRAECCAELVMTEAVIDGAAEGQAKIDLQSIIGVIGQLVGNPLDPMRTVALLEIRASLKRYAVLEVPFVSVSEKLRDVDAQQALKITRGTVVGLLGHRIARAREIDEGINRNRRACIHALHEIRFESRAAVAIGKIHQSDSESCSHQFAVTIGPIQFSGVRRHAVQ